MKKYAALLAGLVLAACHAMTIPADAQVVHYLDNQGVNPQNVTPTQGLPVNCVTGCSGSSDPSQADPGSDATKAVAVQGVTGAKAVGVSAASGALVDGAIATLGAKTDAKSTATDSTSVTIMQVLKQISASAQAGTSTPASSVPSSGVYINGRAATAAPTAVTDGQSVGVQLTETGRTVTAPYSIKELMVRGTATSTGTGATTIIASAGGSLKNYITAVQCGRTDAGSSALTITFNDSASTVVVLPAGGATNITFPTPLATAAATAFQFTSGTGVTTLYCSAQGYTGL